LRASGTLYQLRENDHTVSNLYNAELVNKTSKELKFEIIPDDPKAKIQYIDKKNKLGYGESAKMTFFVILPQESIITYKSDLSFKLVSGGKIIDRFETTFIAPPNE